MILFIVLVIRMVTLMKRIMMMMRSTHLKRITLMWMMISVCDPVNVFNDNGMGIFMLIVFLMAMMMMMVWILFIECQYKDIQARSIMAEDPPDLNLSFVSLRFSCEI